MPRRRGDRSLDPAICPCFASHTRALKVSLRDPEGVVAIPKELRRLCRHGATRRFAAKSAPCNDTKNIECIVTRIKYPFIALLLCGLFLSARGASAEHLLAPAQAVAPFLYPPYPGTASQESIFDHSTPNYTYDNRVVAFNGKEARKDCPVPAPPGVPPPVAGVCNSGDGIYWSYSLADWVAYDGHDGVDYGISYRPVYAAADADQVISAGWWDPQNHKLNLGINVRLHHANGYNTYYGHMSAVSVQACGLPGCTFIPHGTMLGISGNTGLSTGPHLHFLLRNPAGKSIDPYGWTGAG